MRLALLPPLLLLCTLVACDAVDTMKEGFKHSNEVSAVLEKKLGLKNTVGFAWSNGVLESVSVNFAGLPKDKGLPEILDQAQKAVAAEFKQTPTQIVISFVVRSAKE